MGVSFLLRVLMMMPAKSMYDGIGYVRTVMGSYFVDFIWQYISSDNGFRYRKMEAQGFKMSGTDLAQIAF